MEPAELLRALRELVDVLDEAALRLVAARLRLARLLGRAKALLEAPVVDEEVEERRRRRLESLAVAAGLSAGLASELYGVVSRWSRCEQLHCPVRVRVAIYGYGSLGRMLATVLRRAGCWVAVTGRDPERAAEVASAVGARALEEGEAIEWADMLVYAVPSDAVPALLESHWRALRESMLVADTASVKAPAARAYARLAARGPAPDYAGLHPLFAPHECSAGETVVVTPVRLGEEWRERLIALLERGLGYRLVFMDPDEHDRVMAVNQVLHHMALDAYEAAARRLAARLGIDVERAWDEAATRSLRSTLELLERLRGIRPVVDEIRSLNPYSREAAEALLEAARRVAEVVRRRGEGQDGPRARRSVEEG